MNMPWSAEQREWLQALGYELFVRAPHALDTTEVRVIGDRVATPAAADAAPQVGAKPATAARRTDGAIDPLLRAMLRAARTDALDEVRAIAADMHRLRTDPTAKRAAWPRLRALRAGRRQ